MRISDWSSDVCSSDLFDAADRLHQPRACPESAAVDHPCRAGRADAGAARARLEDAPEHRGGGACQGPRPGAQDRKSTRLNSRSLMRISYAVFCLKKTSENRLQTSSSKKQQKKRKQ